MVEKIDEVKALILLYCKVENFGGCAFRSLWRVGTLGFAFQCAHCPVKFFIRSFQGEFFITHFSGSP
uniref:Uncharacterized protein n=1 Tax=Anguilla anguilla TaxID=7936 RepID=A0A0E9VKH3_ANGAN